MKSKNSQKFYINKKNFKNYINNIFFLIFILFFIIFSLEFFGSEEIKKTVESLGIYGIIFFILAKASTLVFAPLSGTPFYFIAPSLFGFQAGLIYTIIGDIIGHCLCFYIGRLYGRNVLNFLLNKESLKKIYDLVSKMDSVKGFILARILFILVIEIVSYAAGLSKLKFFPFFTVTLLAIIITNFLMVYLGEIILKSSYTYFILVLLGIVGVLAIYFNGKLKKR